MLRINEKSDVTNKMEEQRESLHIMIDLIDEPVFMNLCFEKINDWLVKNA